MESINTWIKIINTISKEILKQTDITDPEIQSQILMIISYTNTKVNNQSLKIKFNQEEYLYTCENQEQIFKLTNETLTEEEKQTITKDKNYITITEIYKNLENRTLQLKSYILTQIRNKELNPNELTRENYVEIYNKHKNIIDECTDGCKEIVSVEPDLLVYIDPKNEKYLQKENESKLNIIFIIEIFRQAVLKTIYDNQDSLQIFGVTKRKLNIPEQNIDELAKILAEKYEVDEVEIALGEIPADKLYNLTPKTKLTKAEINRDIDAYRKVFWIPPKSVLSTLETNNNNLLSDQYAADRRRISELIKEDVTKLYGTEDLDIIGALNPLAKTMLSGNFKGYGKYYYAPLDEPIQTYELVDKKWVKTEKIYNYDTDDGKENIISKLKPSVKGILYNILSENGVNKLVEELKTKDETVYQHIIQKLLELNNLDTDDDIIHQISLLVGSNITIKNEEPSIVRQVKQIIGGEGNSIKKAVNNITDYIKIDASYQDKYERKSIKKPLCILIVGESGTGKELVADALHTIARPSKKIEKIDCSTVVKSLGIGTILFGSEKGAYTGAEQKIGAIESVEDGDIFLDEFHRLDQEIRDVLLRVLENGEYKKLGSDKTQIAKCRFIIAVHPSFLDEATPDILSRISTRMIKMPSLIEITKEKPSDIINIISNINEKINKEKEQNTVVSMEAITLIQEMIKSKNISKMNTRAIRELLIRAHEQIEIEMKDSNVVTINGIPAITKRHITHTILNIEKYDEDTTTESKLTTIIKHTIKDKYKTDETIRNINIKTLNIIIPMIVKELLSLHNTNKIDIIELNNVKDYNGELNKDNVFKLGSLGDIIDFYIKKELSEININNKEELYKETELLLYKFIKRNNGDKRLNKVIKSKYNSVYDNLIDKSESSDKLIQNLDDNDIKEVLVNCFSNDSILLKDIGGKPYKINETSSKDILDEISDVIIESNLDEDIDNLIELDDYTEELECLVS